MMERTNLEKVLEARITELLPGAISSELRDLAHTYESLQRAAKTRLEAEEIAGRGETGAEVFIPLSALLATIQAFKARGDTELVDGLLSDEEIKSVLAQKFQENSASFKAPELHQKPKGIIHVVLDDKSIANFRMVCCGRERSSPTNNRWIYSFTLIQDGGTYDKVNTLFLGHEDICSLASFRKWCLDHGVRFFGTDDDLQKVVGHMLALFEK